MEKPVPEPDEVSRFYWEAALEGRLVVQSCSSCRRYLFPPSVACPRCLTDTLVPTAVSGRGRVHAFTVARQAFDPSFDVPYVLALVELEEDPEVRILTNLVESDPGAVSSGAPVEVVFEARGTMALPQFRLVGTPA
ncbi:MAG TPA: OB-fold domain-containing protein [Acidimicrobiales bacterium]|nr:OB-fold domain-containing protein [Acidimicrobiales bacterium]